MILLTLDKLYGCLVVFIVLLLIVVFRDHVLLLFTGFVYACDDGYTWEYFKCVNATG